jgi:hypothetical protein
VSARVDRYSLYGLTVESNRPLVGAPSARGDEDRLVIDFAGALEPTDALGTPFRKNWLETLWHSGPGAWVLRYDDTASGAAWAMRADEGGERLTVTWSDDAMLEGAPFVVQGIGVALALHLQGVPLLHACVVETDGAAIALLGDGGAGKSTTAAAFVRSGLALLSDDLAALALSRDAVLVHPGYAHLRLFADTARVLGWDPTMHPRLPAALEGIDKRCIELDEAQGTFCARSLPLRAIYLLKRRVATADRPRIEALPPLAALPLLMRNVFLRHYLDRPRLAQAWRDCALLAERVPVRTVAAPDSLATVAGLADALVEDAALQPAVAP